MYRFLSTISPDYSGILSITPRGNVIVTSPLKKQTINQYDDESEERVDFSSTTYFNITIPFDLDTESRMDLIIDLYSDPSKANGTERSFLWQDPITERTYVAYFNKDIVKEYYAHNHRSIHNISLRIVGNSSTTPSEWILADGTWTDDGTWDDTETWNDGT